MVMSTILVSRYIYIYIILPDNHRVQFIISRVFTLDNIYYVFRATTDSKEKEMKYMYLSSVTVEFETI